MTELAALPSPSPVFIRVAHGDIVDVHASLVAVGHVNDVAPTGAEQAVDALLGGAITSRQTSLRGRLGTTHYLPTVASPLAAGCVLIVCLGDAEHFTSDRLAEAGAAIVDAAAAVGVRDVATIVPAASVAAGGARTAARLLVTGALAALQRVPPQHALRELTLVEKDRELSVEVLRGAQEAASIPSVHVYFDTLEVRRRVAPEVNGSATPPHLRVGLTRSGPELKITRIGDDAFDRACVCPYPADVSEKLPAALQDEVFLEQDADRRIEHLGTIGAHLFNSFVGVPQVDVDELFDKPRGAPVVLRLDAYTVDLPWELARLPDGRVLGREFAFGRQLEIGNIGRAAAHSEHDGPLRALVIGNASGSPALPGAAREAELVADCLEQRVGADVVRLIGEVTYEDVSRELNDRAYDVMHYAGHADFVEGRQQDSGLRLADALLTPADLATRQYVPRLVFANACHSAATGTPNHYAGANASRTLVSGVLGAGARAFVGAMWQVADDAAVTFAGAFYDAIARTGDGPQWIGTAMQLGREAVIAEHGEGHPAWAAYALYGSPWRRAV